MKHINRLASPTCLIPSTRWLGWVESILAYESPVEHLIKEGVGAWAFGGWFTFEEHALGQVLTLLGFSQPREG